MLRFSPTSHRFLQIYLGVPKIPQQKGERVAFLGSTMERKLKNFRKPIRS